jgi:hypothetical protein
MNVYRVLERFDACKPALKWIKRKGLEESPKEAYESCVNPHWLAWLIFELSTYMDDWYQAKQLRTAIRTHPNRVTIHFFDVRQGWRRPISSCKSLRELFPWEEVERIINHQIDCGYL